MTCHSFNCLNFLYILTYKPQFHTLAIPFSHKWAIDAIIFCSFHISDCDFFFQINKIHSFYSFWNFPSRFDCNKTIPEISLFLHYYHFTYIKKDEYIKKGLKISHILMFSNFLIILHCYDTQDDRFQSMTLANVDIFLYTSTILKQKRNIIYYINIAF